MPKSDKKVQTSPCGSHVVTNHSTKQAQSRLTSLIGREEVLSWWYERLLENGLSRLDERRIWQLWNIHVDTQKWSFVHGYTSYLEKLPPVGNTRSPINTPMYPWHLFRFALQYTPISSFHAHCDNSANIPPTREKCQHGNKPQKQSGNNPNMAEKGGKYYRTVSSLKKYPPTHVYTSPHHHSTNTKTEREISPYTVFT